MIKLNGGNKHRINEKDINYYNPSYEMGLPIIKMIICGDIENLIYSSERLRDKDIEMLDKLLDVKSIEDKANAYPHEIDVLNYTVSGIKKENEPVKEEYLTWEEVKQCETRIVAEFPNGAKIRVMYILAEDYIKIYSPLNELVYGEIYNRILFNSLKLKRVKDNG